MNWAKFAREVNGPLKAIPGGTLRTIGQIGTGHVAVYQTPKEFVVVTAGLAEDDNQITKTRTPLDKAQTVELGEGSDAVTCLALRAGAPLVGTVFLNQDPSDRTIRLELDPQPTTPAPADMT